MKNIEKLSEDKIRETFAESGKTTVPEMMSYIERFHKGNYDKEVARKNAKEMVEEIKKYS